MIRSASCLDEIKELHDAFRAIRREIVRHESWVSREEKTKNCEIFLDSGVVFATFEHVARVCGKEFNSFTTKQKLATGKEKKCVCISLSLSRSLSALNLQFSVSRTTSVERRAMLQIVDGIPWRGDPAASPAASVLRVLSRLPTYSLGIILIDIRSAMRNMSMHKRVNYDRRVEATRDSRCTIDSECIEFSSQEHNRRRTRWLS